MHNLVAYLKGRDWENKLGKYLALKRWRRRYKYNYSAVNLLIHVRCIYNDVKKY
jgi:hypothetical protein